MKLDGHVFLSANVAFVPAAFYTQLAMMTGLMPMLWTHGAKAVGRFEVAMWNVLDLPPTQDASGKLKVYVRILEPTNVLSLGDAGFQVIMANPEN